MIELIKALPEPAPQNGRLLLIDVGTGNGCIGITALLEKPELTVWLSEISPEALAVADDNIDALVPTENRSSIRSFTADLLNNERFKPGSASIVTANLPYVSHDYEITSDAKAEPELALYADDAGYALIEQLLPQAARVLLPGGYLLLESDPWQQERIISSADVNGFRLTDSRRFHLVLQLSSS